LPLGGFVELNPDSSQSAVPEEKGAFSSKETSEIESRLVVSDDGFCRIFSRAALAPVFPITG
jgi:hypothetical protein